MTFVDQYGLELTTDSAAAADAYVDGLVRLLANHAGAGERLALAAQLDPQFALAYAAIAFQRQVQREIKPPVAEILLAARCAPSATRREQQVVEVLRRAIVGDTATARRLTESHLEDFPRDALMVRERALLLNYCGRAGRKTDVATMLAALAPHFGDDPWFLGVHGMALSETGELAAAVDRVETGLQQRPGSALLAHTRAHIYFENADDSGGRAFVDRWLTDHAATAANAGHLAWHLALTDLALSQPERALERYHHWKDPESPGIFPLEDHISLVWRLQLRGLDVDGEWADLVQASASMSPRRAFELAHIGFALAAVHDERGLHELTAQVEREAASRPDQPYRFLPPLLDALRLVATERWCDAVPALEHATPDARRLGGSNEQHTLFEETIAYARAHA